MEIIYTLRFSVSSSSDLSVPSPNTERHKSDVTCGDTYIYSITLPFPESKDLWKKMQSENWSAIQWYALN